MHNGQILYQKFKESNGVSIDTRTIIPEQMFFAIKGDRFDGHNFISNAIERGASLVVIDDPSFYDSEHTILVPNTLSALQQVAMDYRSELDIPFLGVTGSNGKTTTKELIFKVLCKKFNVYATQGNLNNHIGVPLTILSIPNSAELAIIEMGANHVGEIADLCGIAKPTSGLITNIGTAHIGEFGSAENIRKGKLELFDHITHNSGVLFVNMDDEKLRGYQLSHAQRVEYSKHFVYHLTRKIKLEFDDESFYCQGYIKDESHSVPFNSQLPGKHNQFNIAAAIATGIYWNVDLEDIAKALGNYHPTNNRSQILQIGSNKVLLDAYNANPDSMKAAIAAIENLESRHKMLILGDMLELGNYSEQEHLKVLQTVNPDIFHKIYLIGELFPRIPGAEYFKNWQDLKSELDWEGIHDSWILIKGSRSLALENLVSDFL